MGHKSVFLPDEDIELLKKKIDPFYKDVRDDSDLRDARDFVEEMWQKYAPYAEPDFQKDAAIQFHSKTWEMHLGCIFLDHDLQLLKKTRKEGPDIHLLIRDRSVWVEAIALESGSGDDAIPEIKEGVADDVPVDKIKLRLTGAIKEKFHKYNTYKDKGIISPDDYYVIAVNGGMFPSKRSGGTIPFIVSSVLPFGDLEVVFDKKSGEIVDSYYLCRDSIKKGSGAKVPTNIFEDSIYSGISGVLYSLANVVDRPENIGSEVEYIHNPHADNKLSLGTFRFGHEWWVEGNVLKSKKW